MLRTNSENTISVVIASSRAYDDAKRAINSAVSQEVNAGVQILVVQNNTDLALSRDIRKRLSSLPLAQKTLIQYHDIGPCRNANVARNYGINQATGKYLAMLDSDDYWLPNHLSNCLSNIGEYDGCFGAFYLDRVSTKSEITGHFSGNLANDLFVKKNIDFRTSTLFFRREALASTMWDEKLDKHQDWGLGLDFVIHNNLKYLKRASTIISTSTSKRMSAATNPKASILFAATRLVEPEKTDFIVSRAIDELRFGGLGGLKTIIQSTVLNLENTSPRRKLALVAASIASKNQLSFKLLSIFVRHYLKFTMKNL